MIVIVPTRNRPQAAAELIEAWQATSATARLAFAVNNDDPQLDAYHKLFVESPIHVGWLRCPAKNMVEALNYAATRPYKHDIIGFMGDDHRPRTVRWDDRIRSDFMLHGPGVVYGNDLIQGENLPTHVFLPCDFVHRAGRMSPQSLTHLYVDNYWRELGRRTSLRYLADVIVEHMHPIAGKAEWDDDYRRVNDGSLYADDAAAYHEFLASGAMERDEQIMNRLIDQWTD